MNIGSISNKNMKPKQPDGVSLENLYSYAVYVKYIYDYTLQFLLDEFYYAYNKKGTFKSTSLKKRERAEEKLGEDDMNKDVGNLLDIVRGTVHFPSLEELLDFIYFTQNFEFDIKDFYKMHNKQVKKLMTDVPVINKLVRNSFNFDVNATMKNKYSFLKNPADLNTRNYMDFKFYICIPVPNIENNLKEDTFMFTEVIATLDDFVPISEKTHNLYEVKRSFKPSKDDDIKKDSFMKAMDALICGINVGAIEEYNKSHAFGIQILPYQDNEKSRLKVLNDLETSITLTNAICNVRNINEGR